ncbi:MAG: anion transporter [Pseudanabaenaceae cyanobacterium SKYGB_i_bin29]|nr:anion transporter [Pseudanabaenaceae cyanobacterium SKYG29]MDW8422444.1 anion transporter [Pseudanabaenaceae cyanobacterium SKYGB_i_bin29]
MREILIYVVLLVTYLGIALGYIPGLRMNRPTIALVGSALLIGLGALSVEQAWRSIDGKTIVFLLSMMVVNAGLAYGGFFQVVLVNLIRLTHNPLGLLVTLVGGSGFLSAFLLNDTLALVCTPLTVQICQVLQLNPVPYLLGLAAATNIGSVATLSGNPQNILIGSFSGIPYRDFALVMTPIAIFGLILTVGLLYLYYPDLRSLKPFPLPNVGSVKTYPPLFYKSIAITIGLMVAFLLGLPLAESALLAATGFLITRRLKPDRFFHHIEWGLLILFCGLFVLTEVVRSTDLLTVFFPLIQHPIGFLTTVTILSNLISNVPTVLLLYPLIGEGDTNSWLLLAAASTLGGNFTLFGAVANLITAEAAEREGHKLNFWTHACYGIPLTIGTLAIAYLWIL